MRKIIFFLLAILFISCIKAVVKVTPDKKTIAEKYFRGIYGCDPSVVDRFANDSISVSYPVFMRLFNKTEIKGKKSVKNFASGFCSKWEEAQITIHDSILEENKLVLFWSFNAKFVGESQLNGPEKNTEHAWGGISLFLFDDEGKILSEIGEESPDGMFYHLKNM